MCRSHAARDSRFLASPPPCAATCGWLGAKSAGRTHILTAKRRREGEKQAIRRLVPHLPCFGESQRAVRRDTHVRGPRRSETRRSVGRASTGPAPCRGVAHAPTARSAPIRLAGTGVFIVIGPVSRLIGSETRSDWCRDVPRRGGDCKDGITVEARQCLRRDCDGDTMCRIIGGWIWAYKSSGASKRPSACLLPHPSASSTLVCVLQSDRTQSSLTRYPANHGSIRGEGLQRRFGV